MSRGHCPSRVIRREIHSDKTRIQAEHNLGQMMGVFIERNLQLDEEMAYSATGTTTRHIYWCIITDLILSKEHCHPESVTFKAKRCLNLRAKSKFLMESGLSSGNDLAIKAEIWKYHMCFEVCLQLDHRTRGVWTLHRFLCFSNGQIQKTQQVSQAPVQKC